MDQHRPILVLNGRLRWTKTLATLARTATPLLSADGGANALARIGLRPDAVIGDLDSLSPKTRAWLGDEALILRPDHDRTDFEKALQYAFTDLQLTRLTVLGALGGRTDHAVNNLGILAREARGPNLVLRSESETILATAADLTLEAEAGETWSFWTHDLTTVVTIEGVRWPVDRQALAVNKKPSISNQAVDSHVRVVPENGTVVICRNMGS